MSRFPYRFPVVLATAFLMAVGAICQTVLAGASAEESCGEFGTTVSFTDSPAEAARQARQEEKLVFVLHVSGHFETPEYT